MCPICPLQQSLRSLDRSISTLQTNVLFDNHMPVEQWLLHRSHTLPQAILHALIDSTIKHFLALSMVQEFFPFWLLDALDDTREWIAEGGKSQRFQSIWKRALTHSEAERLSLQDAYLTSELESCDCEDCPLCLRLSLAYTDVGVLLDHMSLDETNSMCYEFHVEGATFRYHESVRTFRYTLQHQPLKLFLFYSDLLTCFEDNPLRPSTLLAWLFDHLLLMEEKELCQSLHKELISMLMAYREELERQKAARLREYEAELQLALFGR